MTPMQKKPLGLGDRVRLLDLAVLMLGGISCLALVGYFSIRLDQPANLTSDHLFFLALAKNYINGAGFRFSPFLGFPDGQDHMYFPLFELTQRLFLWIAGRATQSPFTAMHALYIVGLIAMFGCAYWALRRLGIRPWIAGIGAMGSILTPYLGMRAFQHDFLALSYAAPLGMGLALSLGAGRETGFKALMRQPFTILTIVVAGASGLYYSFFSQMFILFAGVAASVGERRPFPILAALSLCVLMTAVTLFSGYGLDLPLALTTEFAGPQRPAHDQIFFGLDLPAAASAFAGLPKVAEGIAATAAAVPHAFAYEGGREWPGLPLTLVLLASPLIVAAVQLQPRSGEKAGPDLWRLVGFSAVCIVFGLLFGARGGLGYIFNLLVRAEIRSDARLMPFLTFAAVVVLCAATEAGARSRRLWLRCAVGAAFAGAIAVSVQPLVGVLAKHQKDALAEPTLAALNAATPALIKAKARADLGAVLELPILRWPEAPSQNQFEAYQHQLPYLFDVPGSKTRWSYGLTDRQPSFGVLAFEAHSFNDLATRARSHGFDGVLIQKRAYDPQAIAAFKEALGRQGDAACPIYEDDFVLLYALKRKADVACGRPG